jgi:glycolate oxidase
VSADPSAAASSRGLLAALAATGDLIIDPDVLSSYRHDQAAPGLVEAGTPAAVARPRTAEHVAAIVAVAAAHGTPVVARGAGSGLSGGANAIDGCVVVSLENMRRIVEVDSRNLTATAQAGVLNSDLRAACAEEGLLYAPDPASADFCTIGGNVATNAGGLCCLRYGVTRDALLAVDVVLADGRRVELGHRTRKGVTGYDLAGLLCGSEGTLGIITQATMRLLPQPPPAHTLAASFPTLDAAGDAVTQICRRHRPSLLEIMDRTTIAAVEAFAPMQLDLHAEAMLFARSDAGALAGREEIDGIASLCTASGADLVVTSDEEAEGRMLLTARRLAFTALERLGATLLDDVAVPLAAVTALLGGIRVAAERHSVRIGTFGHAGDGNMHPTIVYDPNDDDEALRARMAFDDIIDLALALGGTATGEHGVGLLKRHAADRELADAMFLHRSVKTAFDPAGILNPGKGLGLGASARWP